MRNACEEVGAVTYGKEPLSSVREQAAEYRDEERTYKRKRDNMETKERIEEMVGPKPVGREGMLGKKEGKARERSGFQREGR